MPHTPDFKAFEALCSNADYVPVYRRLVSDTLTPVAAFHRLDSGKAACLFESVIGGEKVGRYSFLGCDPILLLEAFRNRTRVTRLASDGNAFHGPLGNPNKKDQVEEFESENPILELRKLLHSTQVAPVEGLPPFIGGAVGYAGYDTVRYVEHLPNAPEDDREIPDLSFAFYDQMVVFDNVQKTVIVLALAPCSKDASSNRAAYDSACRRVDLLVDRLTQPSTSELVAADIDISGDFSIDYTSNFTKAGYEAAVRKCVEYIQAGDIFQVVLSQRLSLPFDLPPFELYRTLRVINPSPFMFYLRTPRVTLVGSSPEILVRVVDREVTVRPLAGTRPRGKTEEEDRKLAEELLADPKERAEHVMLVDLGRNDVGRVAKFGSVQLSDVMEIERYSHVMHITSNVTGTLAEGMDAFDALAACLPAGTVSGAPKVRAMEIIDEFEPYRRGPYAGAVGYMDFNGNMDTCIALRTVVIANDIAYVQAGAGLVADSVPETEYQETLNKAKGVLKAIALTRERVE